MTTILQVFSASLREIAFTDKKGQPAKFFTQIAYLHSVNELGEKGPVPDKFELALPRGATVGYAPGMYTLHPSSVFVDRNGKLTVSPRLVPEPAVDF